MLLNIPANVAKHSGECRQTFRGMLPNILRNFVPVAKHNGECRQTFRGMSSDSQECLYVCMYTLFTVGQKLSSIYINNDVNFCLFTWWFIYLLIYLFIYYIILYMYILYRCIYYIYYIDRDVMNMLKFSVFVCYHMWRHVLPWWCLEQLGLLGLLVSNCQ